jgi:hypothetical protein
MFFPFCLNKSRSGVATRFSSMFLMLNLLLVLQLEIDGDFLYFLADAAVTAVIDMTCTFSLLIYSFLAISCTQSLPRLSSFVVFCTCFSFSTEIRIYYASLLLKQRRMERIWWYAFQIQFSYFRQNILK